MKRLFGTRPRRKTEHAGQSYEEEKVLKEEKHVLWGFLASEMRNLREN
jgi:hypothetical protein